MKRNVHLSEKLLLTGFIFILLFMIGHDWIPLGSLNDVQALSEDRSFNERFMVTLFGTVQFLLLTGLLLTFIGKRYPLWVKLWLIIHPLCIFIGALFSWWIPYLFGYGAEERADRYQYMFGNTHSFLPEINGIVPNTLHILFHTTLFICIILAIYISLANSKKEIRSY